MADKKSPGNPKKPLQEDSIIARLKSASGGELAGLTSYIGLLGRSSKDGYWLLYPTLDMSTSLEIQESDIVHSEPLPPEQSPFGGLGGTRVFVRKGAQVTTTRTISRTHQAGDGDEFDLDIRVGKLVFAKPPFTADCLPTINPWACWVGGGGPGSFDCPPPGPPVSVGSCDPTCATCGTCPTCHTCPTKCGTCQTFCACYTNVQDSCYKVCQ